MRLADAADVIARESYERIRAIFRPGVDKPSILRVLRGGNFLWRAQSVSAQSSRMEAEKSETKVKVQHVASLPDLGRHANNDRQPFYTRRGKAIFG